MKTRLPHPPAAQGPRPGLRYRLARRRRAMAAHALHGTCYGIGTGVAGLVFWWIEQTL
ncbi:hypothetical protein [Streptomyces niveus]|uniref:hypothetical protein n=1 Tax=Streptomyces niveus TaxID=193462 RepID=UPI0035DAD474